MSATRKRDLAVLRALGSLRDRHGRACVFSAGLVAGEARCSTSTARRALEEFNRAGIVARYDEGRRVFYRYRR